MDTGKCIYKCRNCGKTFEGSATSGYDIMHAHFTMLIMTGEPMPAKIGDPPLMIESHICNVKDDEIDILGVADLIGFKRVKQ